MFTCPYPPAEPQDLLQLTQDLCAEKEFLSLVSSRFRGSPADAKLIKDAYEYFSELFHGQVRDRGGTVMDGHLTPVAVIMMEYWQLLDPTIIVAALGHDSLEDFKTLQKSELEHQFGFETTDLIEGLTKPPLRGRSKRSLSFCEETVQKIVDHGTLCFHLKMNGDRLQNILTLHGSRKKKKWKIWETERFYLPQAARLKLPTQELRKAIAYQRKCLHIDDAPVNYW
jgi:(p)ppGpp synthase/HD superfamily hydrolase